MSRGDGRALQKAAEALSERAIAKGPCDGWRLYTTQAIIDRYLDALLGDEAAEEAAFDLYAAGPWGDFISFVGEHGQTAAMDNHSIDVYREMVHSVLLSLRSSSRGTNG